ncbi:sugar phosphate isomerase/epimerase family protein [Leifsonia poae]|uniref:sugar phosphate isomerase/epimerase family protein n=1 Tax=Leifsonia poae TaxID=110933 RepID=UPI003D6677DC
MTAQDRLIGSTRRAAVQLFTVRDAVAQGLEATLDRLADIGYHEVELYDFVDQPARFADALARSTVRAPVGHAPFLHLDWTRIFDAASTLGLTTVINPSSAAASWSDPDYSLRLADTLNDAADQARAYGLTVGYHNHSYEFENLRGDEPAFLGFAHRLDPRVVLEVDTYWAAVGGVNVIELLTELGDRVRYLHVKDGPLTKVGAEQLPLGAGLMPVAEILAAAPRALGIVEMDGYAGGDVFDALAESLRFLEDHGWSAS